MSKDSTDYIGDFVYHNNKFSRYNWRNGYIVPAGSSDSWDRSLSPLSCILPGLYSNSKNECVSLYFDSKYPNNVNYKNVLPEGIKGYVYKIY